MLKELLKQLTVKNLQGTIYEFTTEDSVRYQRDLGTMIVLNVIDEDVTVRESEFDLPFSQHKISKIVGEVIAEAKAISVQGDDYEVKRKANEYFQVVLKCLNKIYENLTRYENHSTTFVFSLEKK